MVRHQQNSRAADFPQNGDPQELELSVLTMQMLCCHSIRVFHFDNGENTSLSKGSNDIFHLIPETVLNITMKWKQ